MKIGFLSDVHLDDAARALPNENVEDTLLNVVKKAQLDALILSGDISSNWQDSISICEMIQNATQTRVYAVPGNHDLWSHSRMTTDIFKQLAAHPCFPINQFIKLTEDWSLFSGMGWYDYSFRTFQTSIEEAASKIKEYWPDPAFIDWQMSDEEFLKVQIKNWENAFASENHNNVIFSQHFVPRKEFLDFRENQDKWNFCNAYIGSEKINEFFKKYHEIKIAPFGHSHKRFGETHLEGIDYICNPVGYFHEWETDSFEQELTSCLAIKII